MKSAPGETIWPALLTLLCGSLSMIWGQKSQDIVIVNSFDEGPEGWQIYDCNGGIEGGGNVFHPVTWESSGGVSNSGYVWGDDSQWRIDTPEKPNSILAFIIYQRWIKGPELDMWGAEVSVYLRGDGLDMKGARCYFWVLDDQNGTRWHYTGHPLRVYMGDWGIKQTFVLRNDESLWHRSWSRNPANPASLDHVLSEVDSYGFSFVGFSGEVTGKFSMDELSIKAKLAAKAR